MIGGLKRILARAGATSAAVALSAAGALAVASPAQADSQVTADVEETAAAVLLASEQPQTIVRQGQDQLCEKIRELDGQDGPCATEYTLSVSAEEVATNEMLEADGDLVAADGTELSEIGAQSAIYTLTWHQEMRGLYYFNWWERHDGRAYYDKNGHVWSTTEKNGYQGDHTCDQGGGVLYSIEVTDCSTEDRYDLSSRAISEWDRFQVHVVANGVPLYTSHNMHVNIYQSGTVLGYH